MNEHNFLGVAQDFIAHIMKGKVQNFTHKGHCSKCGECCSNLLPLSHKEIMSIRSYISEHDIKPMPLIRGKYIFAGICPFLNIHRKCMIYDVRPLICKVFKCNRKAPSEKYIKIFLQEKRLCVDVRNTFFHEEVNA